MSELSVVLKGEEAQLFILMNQVVQKVKEQERGFEQLEKASERVNQAQREAARQATASAAQGERIAQRVIREHETLEESYKRQADLMEKAFAAGKIDAQQYERALEGLKRQNKELGDAQEKAAREASDAWQAQQRDANEGISVVRRLEQANETLEQKYTALRQKITAAWQAGKIDSTKYAESLRLVDKEYEEVAQAARRAKTEGEQAVGPSAIQQLATFAGGWLSIQSAINVATQALQEYNAEREKGRTETERLEDARRRLFQVSKGDFAQLEARADAAAGLYGIDRGAARQLLFTARSEGFEDDYEQIVRLMPIISPEAGGRVAGQVRSLFSKEGVTTDQALSAVFAGADASRLNFEEMSAALPTVAAGGRRQKAGIDETIASLSVLASVFKTGDVTADRLAGFAGKMALDPRLAGRGLVGGFQALEGMSEEDRTKFLGDSKELNEAYAAFKEYADDIIERAKVIRSARLNATLDDEKIAEFMSQPALAANMLAQGSENLNRVAAERKLSEQASLDKAFKERVQAGLTNTEANFAERWLINRILGLANATGGNVEDKMPAPGPGMLGAIGISVRSLEQSGMDETNKLLKELVDQGRADTITRPNEDK